MTSELSAIDRTSSGLRETPSLSLVVESYPLSPNQAGLWHIQQLVPESTGYNAKFIARVVGSLDLEALRDAATKLVDRHAALRTTFGVDNGVPFQRVHARLPFHFEVADVAGLDDAAVRARAAADLARPFALQDGPAFRCHVYRRAPGDQLLMLSLHHLLTDLTTMAVLVEDLAALYDAELAGTQASLPELRGQYPDFVKWQQNALASENGKKAEAYWRDLFSDTPGILELPADHPRPGIPTYRGSVRHFYIEPRVANAMRAIGVRDGRKPFEVFLATFQVLLHRFAREERFFVGTLMSGRPLPRFLPMAGYFTNLIPTRADFSGDPSFMEHMARVSASLRSGHEHRNYPFAMMTRFNTAPVREAGGTPYVRTAFGLQTTERLKHAGIFDLGVFGDPAESRWKVGSLVLEPWSLTHQDGNFDLQLWMSDIGESIACELKYSTDLFEAATVDRMVESYRVLLEDLIERPEAPVSSLDVLPAPQRARQLVEWNDTRRVEDARPVFRMIADQAAKRPEAVAAVFEGETLTYRELEERSNQLAHHLIALGAKPGALVGLFVERSPRMLVGLLGILKTGAAYIPMDPIYPEERLRWMVEDAQPVAIVSEARLARALTAAGVRIDLDKDRDAIAARPRTDPGVAVSPDDLAYVIFTSGSTGRPKGVELRHRGLSSFLHTMQEAPGISANDTLLAVTTLSFDIAALELFLPLVVGARVAIASREAALDGGALVRLLASTRATIMQATPVTWRMLLAAGWAGSPEMKILCGGEALPNDLARELIPRSKQLWNMYGPTETTIWSLVHLVRAADESGVAPIGRPIANTTLYVLDSARRPLPIGVTGELYIGGAGVARGYLGRPELTAEKFVPDPFCGDPEARMYRTGDLARYRPDGVVEFFGRADNQIKLRGFRIELQEIEAVLSEHPGVRQAAVILAESNGEQRLIAYVVPSGAEVPGDLREVAKTKLPEYMVPAGVVSIEALPLTPNGKVDRRALAARKDQITTGSAVREAPRDPLELELSRLFEEVLGVPRIGVRQSFFDVGGHSMLALKLADQIERSLGKEVSVATIFNAPTVAELAQLLRGQGLSSSWRSLHVLQPEGTGLPLFFIGSIPYARALIPYLGKDAPMYGLNFWDLVSGTEKEEKRHTVSSIAHAYLDEIRSIQPKGPYRICAYCDDGMIAHEIATLLSEAGEKVAFLGVIDFRSFGRNRPIDPVAFLKTTLEFGVPYLQRRANRRWVKIKRAVETAKSRVLTIHQGLTHGHVPVADSHRLLHLDYLRALAEHRPRYFPGKVTLFASREMVLRVPPLRDHFLARKLETIEVTGYHDELFKHPQVEMLGDRLRECLARAKD